MARIPGVNGIDSSVTEWLYDHQSRFLERACDVAMWFGSAHSGMALGGLIMVVICVLRRRGWVVVASVASLLLAGATSIVLKNLFERARPPQPYIRVVAQGYSFPSTAMAVTTAGLVVLLLLAPARRWARRMWWGMLAILDAFIGFAVIYLGAHYLSDVVAGFVLGAAFGFFGVWVYGQFENRLRVRRG